MKLMLDWLRKNLGRDHSPKGRSQQRSLRLRRIFDDTQDLGWGLLRRFGVPPTRLEDAFQEVYLIVAERLDDIEPGKERSFVFGVALRVARGSQRAHWREVLSDEVDVPVESDLGAEASFDRKRLVELCDGFLATLTPELREVFLLHELEGFTGAEIANTLDIPEGTVHSRLRRSRQLLRCQVEALNLKLERNSRNELPVDAHGSNA